MSGFQIAIIGVFIFFIIAGVLLFAGVGGLGNNDAAIGPVEIWGTFDGGMVTDLIRQLEFEDARLEKVSYRQIDARSFDETLVEALASGTGPDLFFLTQDKIVRHADKIAPVPESVLSEREFRDTFIQEGELYLAEDGIAGLPLTVDPLVMYWNRDHYARAGIARPPQFWDEFLTLSLDGSLTKRNQDGTLEQSALALGEYRNIPHAKELLSLLIMQAGSPIVNRGEGGRLTPELSLRLTDGQSPAENALRFYTDFVNPTKSVYSWNRSLPEARAAFVGGKLATYFGFASEINLVRQQNPNLNFDVALMPQVRSAPGQASFGNMVALAAPKSAKNLNGGLTVALILTSPSASKAFSEALGLPPVRRDLLQNRPSDPYRAIFAEAALQARGWLDPGVDATEGIFGQMIESVTSGRQRISDAISTAESELITIMR